MFSFFKNYFLIVLLLMKREGLDWIEWCLTPLQHLRSYHGGQFHWWRKPEDPADLRQVTYVLPNMQPCMQWLEA